MGESAYSTSETLWLEYLNQEGRMTSHQFPQPPVIAALHCPPFPLQVIRMPGRWLWIRDFALRNVDKAVNAESGGCTFKTWGIIPYRDPSHPIPWRAWLLSAPRCVRLFQSSPWGMPDGPWRSGTTGWWRKPLEHSSSDLKVYVGAMVKAEGRWKGCAADAVR